MYIFPFLYIVVGKLESLLLYLTFCCLRAKYFFSSLSSFPHFATALAPKNSVAPASHVLILGAGLAGAAAARALADAGCRVTVHEAGPAAASGASGLPAGLLAPHVSGDDNVLSQIVLLL